MTDLVSWSKQQYKDYQGPPRKVENAVWTNEPDQAVRFYAWSNSERDREILVPVPFD